MSLASTILSKSVFYLIQPSTSQILLFALVILIISIVLPPLSHLWRFVTTMELAPTSTIPNSAYQLDSPRLTHPLWICYTLMTPLLGHVVMLQLPSMPSLILSTCFMLKIESVWCTILINSKPCRKFLFEFLNMPRRNNPFLTT